MATSTGKDNSGRLRRLAEELDEEGFTFLHDCAPDRAALVLEELEYALHPAVHERRIPSYGSIIDPTVSHTDWEAPTELTVSRTSTDGLSLGASRRFADGLSSWLVRLTDGHRKLVVFDRAAGSERDQVILADATGAVMVQRHPAGSVRLTGPFGVMRWDGIAWHHEPPVAQWIDAVSACGGYGDEHVLATLLEFAVHDLGARGIGTTLVYRPDDDPGPAVELRLPEPPPLRVTRAADLAPLGHVLKQVDGATVLDRSGTLRQLGVRLVPSPEAESDVEGFRGMRHTSARRYSFDDPLATVIVVSEDGPVTVLRNGELLGQTDSNTADPTPDDA
jgi:hypothetical protein